MADNEKLSLPSIQQWFPENMLRVSPEIRVKGSAPPTLIPAHPYIPPPPVRKSSPADTRSDADRMSSPSRRPQVSSEDINEDRKKHICTICNKSFTRPSSLNIHVNTHTGATPYRCSLPGCGKEFNVKSNMLRHYRTHNDSVLSQSSSPSQDILSENPSVMVREDGTSIQFQNYKSLPSQGSSRIERDMDEGSR